MSTLEDIKKRAENASPGPWRFDAERWLESEAPVGEYVIAPGEYSVDVAQPLAVRASDADFIAHSRTDVPKLVAALEAVEGMTGKLLDASDSPPGQDEFNKGVDQGFAIAAKAIRSAIEEALR